VCGLEVAAVDRERRLDRTSRLAELPVDESVARALWLGDWDAWREMLADDA
jgi:hypothetical protein